MKPDETNCSFKCPCGLVGSPALVIFRLLSEATFPTKRVTSLMRVGHAWTPIFLPFLSGSSLSLWWHQETAQISSIDRWCHWGFERWSEECAQGYHCSNSNPEAFDAEDFLFTAVDFLLWLGGMDSNLTIRERHDQRITFEIGTHRYRYIWCLGLYSHTDRLPTTLHLPTLMPLIPLWLPLGISSLIPMTELTVLFHGPPGLDQLSWGKSVLGQKWIESNWLSKRKGQKQG